MARSSSMDRCRIFMERSPLAPYRWPCVQRAQGWWANKVFPTIWWQLAFHSTGSRLLANKMFPTIWWQLAFHSTGSRLLANKMFPTIWWQLAFHSTGSRLLANKMFPTIWWQLTFHSTGSRLLGKQSVPYHLVAVGLSFNWLKAAGQTRCSLPFGGDACAQSTGTSSRSLRGNALEWHVSEPGSRQGREAALRKWIDMRQCYEESWPHQGAEAEKCYVGLYVISMKNGINYFKQYFHHISHIAYEFKNAMGFSSLAFSSFNSTGISNVCNPIRIPTYQDSMRIWCFGLGSNKLRTLIVFGKYLTVLSQRVATEDLTEIGNFTLVWNHSW